MLNLDEQDQRLPVSSSKSKLFSTFSLPVSHAFCFGRNQCQPSRMTTGNLSSFFIIAFRFTAKIMTHHPAALEPKSDETGATEISLGSQAHTYRNLFLSNLWADPQISQMALISQIR